MFVYKFFTAVDMRGNHLGPLARLLEQEPVDFTWTPSVLTVQLADGSTLDFFGRIDASSEAALFRSTLDRIVLRDPAGRSIFDLDGFNGVTVSRLEQPSYINALLDRLNREGIEVNASDAADTLVGQQTTVARRSPLTTPHAVVPKTAKHTQSCDYVPFR